MKINVHLYDQLEKDTYEQFLIWLQNHIPVWGCFFYHFYEFLLSFTVRFMKLENLLEDMKHPCVLDIKMGRKTYDPYASKEKIAMETAKFPPAKNIGYQISGMLVEIFVFILISKSIRISNIF